MARRTGQRWAARGRAVGCAVAMALLTSIGILGAPTASAAEPGGANCRSVNVPVTIAGQSGPIAGTLCGPDGATTLQVLVHGLSYGEYYWDLPYQPDRYSYPRMANKRGYATLTIDRLGIGRSWHPLSPLVTYDTNTDAVHQVIQAARRGDLGKRFDKVALIGHSLGSAIAYQEAGTYQDVDAMVATGIAHFASLTEATELLIKTTPAFLDPKFAHSGYDPGYMTTSPGAREIFYHRPNADPEVIALDERLKQTFNHVELGSALSYLATSATKLPATSPSKRINIPTLTMVGSEDQLMCKGPVHADCSSDEALAAFERPYFGPGATVEAKIVKGAGHDLNLELSAPASNTVILDFIDRQLG